MCKNIYTKKSGCKAKEHYVIIIHFTIHAYTCEKKIPRLNIDADIAAMDD